MKIQSAWWLIKRPALWPQGLEILKRRIFLKNDELGKEDSINWCQTQALSEKEAIEKITGIQNAPSIESFLKIEYLSALEKQAECPVTMGGPGALTLLYHVTNHFKPKRLIETGVAYGWSTWALLNGCKRHNASLISIDMPYISLENDKFVGCCVSQDLKSNWILLRKADRQGLPLALKKHQYSIDFCHYDSDKSYSGRKWAYQKLWKHLSKDGIFISDDIQDNIAFKEFCESKNLSPIIVESNQKYVGIIMKKAFR